MKEKHKNMARKKVTFETAMEELESYVEVLEQGNLTLDEAIKVFQKGLELSQFCSEELNKAEKKILIVNEELEEVPLILEEE